MKITVLSGGVGGARFLRGVRENLQSQPADHEMTAVLNVGDGMWLAGLRITSDLDSIMYTLAGENDEVRGWGRVGESERVSAGAEGVRRRLGWFTLGDLYISTHLTRTSYLRDGIPLSEATARITARWPLGVRLLPATDQEVETHVVTAQRTMHFQEWWTRYRAALPALAFEHHGIESAVAAPGVLEAIAAADVVVLASNPVVSIDPILAIPGIRSALLSTAAPVVGVADHFRGRGARDGQRLPQPDQSAHGRGCCDATRRGRQAGSSTAGSSTSQMPHSPLPSRPRVSQ